MLRLTEFFLAGFTICIFFNYQSYSTEFESRESLQDALLENYNKLVCPQNGQPITAKIALSIMTINNNDHRLLEMDTFLTIEWKDFRLSWKHENYDKFDKIYLNSDLLWIPDIVQLNTGKPMLHFPSINVLVFNNGTVLGAFPVTVKSTCSWIRKWNRLFSLYSCPLRFGSWSYDGSFINVTTLNNSSVDFEDFIEGSSHKYEVVGATTHENVTRHNCWSGVCPYVSFDIEIKETIAG